MKPPGSLRNADTASWIASGAFLMPSSASFACAVKASTKPKIQFYALDTLLKGAYLGGSYIKRPDTRSLHKGALNESGRNFKED